MEDVANPAVETEGHEAEEQTVTYEQFIQLQKKLDETKSAQSGSDRRVQELTELLKQREQAAENDKKSADEKSAERMAAIEQKLADAEREKKLAMQRSVAMELLSEVGLKSPKFLDRLIGEDAETTKALVKEYIEDKQASVLQGKDEVARAHGRTVTKTDPTGYGGMTYQQMQALPDAEFSKIPSSVVEQAVEAELKH